MSGRASSAVSQISARLQGKGEAEAASPHLLPSAPPLPVSLSAVLDGGGDLMSLEPPTWLPDSHCASCQKCDAPFVYVPTLCSCTRCCCQAAPERDAEALSSAAASC